MTNPVSLPSQYMQIYINSCYFRNYHYLLRYNLEERRSISIVYLDYKGKVTPLQARCGPECGWRYSFTLPWPRHYKGVWMVSVMPRPHFTPGKDPVPIVQEAGWAPGPVWTGAENFVPTGIRSPDRPGRSQSLYRMSYRAHLFRLYHSIITLVEIQMLFKSSPTTHF
jgi:hypothetical protein